MKRVLIVEDNDNNLELISFILEANGYTTIKAMNGYTGVRMALEETPDFVILDIQLPDIDGVEVLRRIRETPFGESVPIIAMTSYAMSGDKQKLLKAGFTGYIEKPIDPERVIGQIEAVLTSV